MIFIVIVAILLALTIAVVRRSPMPPVLRSIFAVLFGFFSMAVALSLLRLASARLFGVHIGQPTSGSLALNVAYSVASAVLGGWVTASIAPRAPVKHAAVLACIIFAFSISGLIHPSPGLAFDYLFFLAIVPPLAAIAGATLPLLSAPRI